MENRGKREQACDRIKDALEEGHKVIAVVSAMGRAGDPYATDSLMELARGVCPEMRARDMDLLLSCGEILAAVLLVQGLRAIGVDAVALTGGQAGIITDECHGDANITSVDPSAVMGNLSEGKVVVVAGFQGRTASGDITTLGRGGSDITASAIGAATGSSFMEIYTDVEGVMTADPDMVPEARTIPLATYDEVMQLAHEGAKVIHPKAVEIARRAKLPIWVRSMRKDSKKTLMTDGERENYPWMYWANGGAVTGVTSRSRLTQLVMALPEGREMEATAGAFEALRGVMLEMINVFPDRFSVALGNADVQKALGLLEDAGADVSCAPGKAKVTAVGYGIHAGLGVMEEMIRALWAQRIGIYASSDSDITLSCLIDEENLERAVNAIHDAFKL